MLLPRPLLPLALGLWAWVPAPALLAAVHLSAVASAKADPGPFEAARSLFNTRGQAAEAQAAFEKFAALDPGDPDVNFHLGQLALRRDDPEKAIRYFETGIAAAPTDARHHHGLGDAYGRCAQQAGVLSKFGLAKKCLAAYERAVALAPDRVDFHQSLFEYYRQAPGIGGGGIDKALAEAAVIKRLDPFRGRLAFATLYVADKKYDQALAEFDEVLKTSPDDYAALYQVGRLAAMSGQYLDRGLASLHRCLELTPPDTAPGHAAAHWRTGNILEKKSDPAAARAVYETALKLEPRFTPAADSLKKLK